MLESTRYVGAFVAQLFDKLQFIEIRYLSKMLVAQQVGVGLLLAALLTFYLCVCDISVTAVAREPRR